MKELEDVINRLIAFLTGTKEEAELQAQRRRAVAAEAEESLNAIGETLAFRLQEARQAPTLTIELSGLADPEAKLPNDFPKNFRFSVNFGELQLQGEDKLLDFDQDSALVEAFKMVLEELPAQTIRIELWEIGEVDSLYSEAEVELAELERATELVFTNNVHLQFRAVLNKQALRMVQAYARASEEIGKELQQLASLTQHSRHQLAERRLKKEARREKLQFAQPNSQSYQERVAQLDEILELLQDGHKDVSPKPAEKSVISQAIEEEPAQHKITEVDEDEEEP